MMRWLDDIRQDLRYGLRSAARARGFSVVVILTLALGVGATTAIFSVVDGVTLKPLPYPESDRLVQVGGLLVAFNRIGAISLPNIRDLRDRTHSFEAMAATRNQEMAMTGDGGPARMMAAVVSASYFDVLETRPAAGRAFSPAEDLPGPPATVIISDELWKRRWGGDPGILGATFTLAGQPFTVIGIMPAGFRAPEPMHYAAPDIWIPLPFLDRDASDRARPVFGVLARMNRGVSLESAAADVDAVMSALISEYPEANAPSGEAVQLATMSMHERTVGDVGSTLAILAGAVGLLLLIACVNVANLFLARASDRGKELALRKALGARRGRIVRQLLAESLVLALMGGAGAMVVAQGGVWAFRRYNTGGIPRVGEIGIDMRVFAFALSVSIVAGALAALIPAIHASRTDLIERMKAGAKTASAGRSHGRLRARRWSWPRRAWRWS